MPLLSTGNLQCISDAICAPCDIRPYGKSDYLKRPLLLYYLPLCFKSYLHIPKVLDAFLSKNSIFSFSIEHLSTNSYLRTILRPFVFTVDRNVLKVEAAFILILIKLERHLGKWVVTRINEGSCQVCRDCWDVHKVI